MKTLIYSLVILITFATVGLSAESDKMVEILPGLKGVQIEMPMFCMPLPSLMTWLHNNKFVPISTSMSDKGQVVHFTFSRNDMVLNFAAIAGGKDDKNPVACVTHTGDNFKLLLGEHL
jgi:hypothetical protein